MITSAWPLAEKVCSQFSRVLPAARRETSRFRAWNRMQSTMAYLNSYISLLLHAHNRFCDPCSRYAFGDLPLAVVDVAACRTRA